MKPLTQIELAQNEFMECLAQAELLDTTAALQPTTSRYVQKILNKLCKVAESVGFEEGQRSMRFDAAEWVGDENVKLNLWRSRCLGSLPIKPMPESE